MFQSAGQSRTDTSKFRAELNVLPPDEWPTRLLRLVSEQASLILRRPIDPDRLLSGCGLDSLGNVELRTRIENETGIRVSSMDITTVRRLAEHLSDKLAGPRGHTSNIVMVGADLEVSAEPFAWRYSSKSV